MKRVFSVVFAVVVLCLVGIKFAPTFIDFESYKDQAIGEFKTRTGLDLKVDGDIELAILPSPRFSVTDVSVSSPEGSKGEYLAKLKRFDVNVALASLFKGKVSVSYVTLVDPVISLEMLENGSLNVLTKQVQSIIKPEEKSTDNVAVPSVSLEKIRIKNGSFSYYDHKSDSDVIILNINSDLSAESLMGPYSAQGSLFYDGYSLNFDVISDAYDVENKILSPKIKLSLQPGDVALDYAGVLSLSEGYSIQGQTSIRIDDVNKALSKYTTQTIVSENTSFESKGLLSIDSSKIDYKNFDLLLGQESSTGSVHVNFAPFKYNISLKSAGNVNLDNIIKDAIPFKHGSFDLHMSGDLSSVKLNNTIVKLDQSAFNLSGEYSFGNKKQRQKIDLQVKAPLFDYDGLVSGLSNESSQKQSVNDILNSLSLPIDMGFKLSVDKFIWQKNAGHGLELTANFSKNSISVPNISINDFAKSSLKASGSVKNLKKASDITAYIDIKSSNIHKTAQILGVDNSEWPENLRKASVKAKISGGTDVLDVTSNISAMGGEVIASGKVSNAFDTPAVDGLVLQIKHKNMSDALKVISGVQLKDKSFKGPLDIYSRIYQNGQRYTLKNLKGDLSGVSVQGDLDINLAGTLPKVKGNLNFGSINLASIMTQGSQKGGNKQSIGQSSTSVRWSKSPIDTSALHAVNINLSLSAKKIEYGAWPLIKPSLTVDLNNGALSITDLKAGLFGGNIDFSTSVKSVSKPRQPIHFESVMKVNNANLGLLSAALLGKKILKVSGKGNLSMNLKSSGASPAALIHDLAGKGVVSGRNITLDGVDVERFARALSEDSKAGDSILGLWNGASKGGTSHFETLDGNFSIKEGIVHLNKMDLDGASTAIETRGGVINLPKWTLATKHKVIVKGIDGQPSDVPPFEISFNGSLDNPAQTFGQGLLQDYLNRKIQRKLSDLLSKKFGKPSNGNAAPASDHNGNSKPADVEDIAGEAIKGILEGLLR